MRSSWRWQVPYVVAVTLLGWDAFSGDPLLGASGEVAAFVLLLPGLFVELPVIYLVGALAWQVRDGMVSRPMWPVTATFALLFLASAVLNSLLVRYLWAVIARSRSGPRRAPGR